MLPSIRKMLTLSVGFDIASLLASYRSSVSATENIISNMAHSLGEPTPKAPVEKGGYEIEAPCAQSL